jgi:hypothetical protein
MVAIQGERRHLALEFGGHRTALAFPMMPQRSRHVRARAIVVESESILLNFEQSHSQEFPGNRTRVAVLWSRSYRGAGHRCP